MDKRIIDENFFGYLEALTLHVDGLENGLFGGIHQTKSHGSSVEFSDFREYNLGDDIKKIDWNLYARFDKYFLKLFVDERQQHVRIFLDVSSSMAFYQDKKENAIKCLAALGFLAVNNMDKLSIYLVKNDQAVRLGERPISRKDEFMQMVNSIEDIRFDGECNFGKAVETLSDIGFGDGLSILISDFLTDDYQKAVNFLQFRHKSVLLVHVLSAEEICPNYGGRMYLMDSECADKGDERNMKLRIGRSEMKAYRLALEEYLAEIKDFAIGRQISYVLFQADEPFERAFLEKLEMAGDIR